MYYQIAALCQSTLVPFPASYLPPTQLSCIRYVLFLGIIRTYLPWTRIVLLHGIDAAGYDLKAKGVADTSRQRETELRRGPVPPQTTASTAL